MRRPGGALERKDMFTQDDLAAAAAVVGAVMPPTPQYAWPLLARRAGAEV